MSTARTMNIWWGQT